MKNQCSAPYVYGKEDLRLEHALGVIETAYACALRKVSAGQKATGEDIGYLLAFMVLQFLAHQGGGGATAFDDYGDGA